MQHDGTDLDWPCPPISNAQATAGPAMLHMTQPSKRARRWDMVVSTYLFDSLDVLLR